MIYKYLVAGLPIPPDLVMPIRRSFDALASRTTLTSTPVYYFLSRPENSRMTIGSFAYVFTIIFYLVDVANLGYCSYYGKKFDPEPGRCRRTDGKKWRCSKDAHPDSKYCERHMHRGRNRSRKHVESQSTSQSFSTAISHISTGSNSTSGSFPNMSLYSVGSSEGSALGRNVTKLQMEPLSYGIHNKDMRDRRFHFLKLYNSSEPRDNNENGVADAHTGSYVMNARSLRLGDGWNIGNA
ncbi:growth-regulating factor 4-like [Dorcoceras hygrometricum]|uniref:Growth-regulating factor n=1 Tax=Dorcoceras hygrometricum TaxID=472368 RepID=A0A2Z7CDX0_9LAMI|nr:growth-regulating factor 4-like [Dorcoceras hygrometricum]